MAENITNNLRNRRKLQPDAINLATEIGKVPPHDVNAEESVLGAMLLGTQAVNDVIDILEAESFYKAEHKKVFGAIHQLFGNSDTIDIITVTQQLRSNGDLDFVGGPAYVAKLTNRIASTAHVEFHARIIAEKYILRSLIDSSSKVIKDAYDETQDVFEVLNGAEESLFKISEGNSKKTYSSVKEAVEDAIDEIKKASENPDGVSGVPSGFTELDHLTSGWQKADMIVLAARPAMGKTALVLSMARNIAVQFGQGVAIFSLEMSNVQLTKRLMAMETGLSSEKLKKGFTDEKDWKQLHDSIGNLADAPIFIDDTPGLSVFELRAKCRRLKQQHDIKMVIIDYLQLMTAPGKGGNREQEISTISRSIKEIAKEIECPIIALSQLSRSVETRGGDKRPMLSDLRESGAIEQDADMVCFIYRPAYYGLTEDESGAPIGDLTEFIVAKHRNGGLDTINLKFVPELTRFVDYDTPDSFYDTAPSAMTVNSGFDDNAPSSGSYTVGSKMNNDDFSSNNTLEDVPF